MQLKDYISARKEEVSMELTTTVEELRGLQGRLSQVPFTQKEQRLQLVEKLQMLQTQVVVQKSIVAELKHLLEIK